MSKLIVKTHGAPAGISIGGVPMAPAGTPWPMCHSCNGPMQFLAQLPLDSVDAGIEDEEDKYILLFQCQNSPGLCDEWLPDSGGNAALLVSAIGREPMPVPAGPTLLPEESRISFQPYDDSKTVETPDDTYCASVDANEAILGKLCGHPLWLQADETPLCGCGEQMVFVAQIEERGGGGINFGGSGAGYAFVCRQCSASAKFLWQC